MNQFDEIVKQHEQENFQNPVPTQIPVQNDPPPQPTIKNTQTTIPQPQLREPQNIDYSNIADQVNTDPETSIIEIFEKYYPRQNVDHEKEAARRRSKAAPFADIGALIVDWVTAAKGGDVKLRQRSAVNEAADYMRGVQELGRRYDNDYNNRRFAAYMQDYAERRRRGERAENIAAADEKFNLQFNWDKEKRKEDNQYRNKIYNRQGEWHTDEKKERRRQFDAGLALQNRTLALNENKTKNNELYKSLVFAQKDQKRTFPFAVGNAVHYIPKEMKGQFADAIIQEAVETGLLDKSTAVRDIQAMTGIGKTKENQQIEYVKNLFNRMPQQMAKLKTLQRYTASVGSLYDNNENTIDWGDETDDNNEKKIDW